MPVNITKVSTRRSSTGHSLTQVQAALAQSGPGEAARIEARKPCPAERTGLRCRWQQDAADACCEEWSSLSLLHVGQASPRCQGGPRRHQGSSRGSGAHRCECHCGATQGREADPQMAGTARACIGASRNTGLSFQARRHHRSANGSASTMLVRSIIGKIDRLALITHIRLSENGLRASLGIKDVGAIPRWRSR